MLEYEHTIADWIRASPDAISQTPSRSTSIEDMSGITRIANGRTGSRHSDVNVSIWRSIK